MAYFRRTILWLASSVILALVLPAAALASDRSGDGAVVVLAHVPGTNGIGAGTIVALNGTTVRVLTANHVAAFGTLQVRFEDGTTVPARILSQFPTRDLAIIEAEVDPSLAATLHAAPVAAPRSHEAVHIWGSGFNGPAYETGAVSALGTPMPDGPANGRFALGCEACHQGDSGGGVFDAQGELVGVFVGYFVFDSGPKLSVAELPLAEAMNIARSNTASTPATIVGSTGMPATVAARNSPSNSASSAADNVSGEPTDAILASLSFTK